MADHVAEALRLRLADLERKRAARQGEPAFAKNVEEIDAAIAQIRGELQARRAQS